MNPDRRQNTIVSATRIIMPISRRHILSACAAGILTNTTRIQAFGPPTASSPFRATDGDDREQTVWDKQITITVGHQKSDIVGQDDKGKWFLASC